MKIKNKTYLICSPKIDTNYFVQAESKNKAIKKIALKWDDIDYFLETYGNFLEEDETENLKVINIVYNLFLTDYSGFWLEEIEEIK